MLSFTYVVFPRHPVHPRVGFYVAFEVYVYAFLNGTAVDVTSEFQIHDRCICERKAKNYFNI